MKIIYWNIRGLANSPSKLALHRLISLHKPDFIFIVEPWMDFNNFPPAWLNRLGIKLFTCNHRENLLPNLWCVCSNAIDPVVIDKDDQQVSFSFGLDNRQFYMSAIYASTNYIKRRDLWQKLSLLQANSDAPWCYIGDFNVILGAHEYSGSFTPARLPMEDFQNWTEDHNLFHLPTRGSAYTWDNKRPGRRHTKKRLDRTICNQQWLDLCATISCSTLVKTTSDHFPLLLEFNTTNQLFASSFKFLKMWTLHSDCRKVVEDCWNVHVIGCPMYVLSTKLKLLKNKLKAWNKEVFGNIHALVTEAESHLPNIQNQIHVHGHSNHLMNEENKAQTNLNDALHKQETFWQEKAKLRWHVDGDRNTKYFHRVTTIKNKTKIISTIRNGEEIISEPHRISEHIVNYYKSLFFSTNIVLQDQLLVEEAIPKLIDDTTNQLLTMIPSLQEVKNAVFDLNSEGAPGPDGFGASFYQFFWEVVSKDVYGAVVEFFTTGWLLPNYNANSIILIPKSPNADTIDQYRPIALANFKFKIITKVLADRLANILPNIISTEQRGFVKGRNIRDCIALTSEAVNLLDKRSFGGNLALKIDVSKAFDTLNWEFLINVLQGFGFNETLCNWIKAIL